MHAAPVHWGIVGIRAIKRCAPRVLIAPVDSPWRVLLRCSDRRRFWDLQSGNDVFVVGEQTHEVRPGYVDREPLDERVEAERTTAKLSALDLR